MSGDEEIRWLSKGLPNMLITDLAQTPGLDVVSSQRIHEILTEIGQEDLETINKSLVPEIAERAGAGAVVVGSIFKSGSEIRLDVQVQDVGSGRVLSAESVRGEDLFPLVDELAGRIRASLSLGDQPSVRPIADVTTPSLDAFQLFTEGLEARRNLRSGDARELFEKAVEIDPSFAIAYFELSNVVPQDSNLFRQYMEKAVELSERLPERQKLLVQATDANRVRGKAEEAVELLETLITRYPDEEDAYDSLNAIYGQLNQPDKALATLERGLKALPRSGPLHNSYGYELIRSGRYAEGLRELETYAELNPDEPNPQDSLAEAYLLTGQPEKALEKYARVLEVNPDFGFSYSGRAWAFAMLGRYDEALIERAKLREVGNAIFSETRLLFMEAFTLSRVGRYQAAEERLSQGMEVAASQGDNFLQASLELLSALLAFEREEFGDVLESMDSARERIPNIVVPGRRRLPTLVAQLLTGAVEVRGGNMATAREQFDSQSTFYDPSDEAENWLHQALRGEIALATGDLVAAENAFADGEPTFKMWFNNGTSARSVFLNNLPFRDGLARVKKAQGDLAGAIRTYRELLTTDMSSKWIAMLEPRYVLELARLLDESGDKESARAEYERFLELWKDADEGLPELKEARAYVAK
jgi:tetratricopeptide (TPR) repeat protein